MMVWNTLLKLTLYALIYRCIITLNVLLLFLTVPWAGLQRNDVSKALCKRVVLGLYSSVLDTSYLKRLTRSKSHYWVVILGSQSELSRPISWNSVESDLGCTSRVYFDNVTLTLHNVTLTSKKPYEHNNKCDCRKNSNERYSDILWKNT